MSQPVFPPNTIHVEMMGTKESIIYLRSLEQQLIELRDEWRAGMGDDIAQMVADLQAQLDATYDELKVHRITVTQADIDAQGITLPEVPVDPSKVLVSPFGGIEQKAGTDFTVTGDFLSWSAMALELLVEPGSELLIRYSV